MPEDQQQDDDRDRNTDKPKQDSLAHIHLLAFVEKSEPSFSGPVPPAA
ncbi:MAG: hypothetical protein QM688_00080 [Sphingomonas bacterium]